LQCHQNTTPGVVDQWKNSANLSTRYRLLLVPQDFRADPQHVVTGLSNCVDSPVRHSKLFPLTEEVIRDHLLGRQTIGVYPLLQDDTCWFVAVDFDKRTWETDAISFLETSIRLPLACTQTERLRVTSLCVTGLLTRPNRQTRLRLRCLGCYS